MQEINQFSPRQVKNNLIYHKIKKIYSNAFNTAVITEHGDLMIHGMNDFGQIVLSESIFAADEISDGLQFFPEFMKIEFFENYQIIDVALGACAIHVLCEDKETRK